MSTHSAAESPQAARRIIKEGKLAVVLGVEVDSVGNWRTEEDLPADPEHARPLLRQELERLYGMGVRQITPIHLTDNAFGGAAIYNRLFDGLNKQITGHHYLVEDAWDTGVRYRLDRDPGIPGFRGFLARWLAYGSPLPRRQRDPSHGRQGGHANSRGLTKHGHVLVEEIMRLGLILDVDHMSQKATDATLDLAERHAYPIILSHTWFRDLAFTVEAEGRAEFCPGNWKRYGTSDVQKVAHEAGKRADQVHRIRRLGGIVAPILNQGDVRTHDARIPNDCPGSSKSWAQAYLYAVDRMQGRGVAFGSDVNGLARLPGPRFGTDAAYPLINDKIRGRLRRSYMGRQVNRVRYEEAMEGNDTPLRRSTAGDRAFDINVDGIAHYGLLPTSSRIFGTQGSPMLTSLRCSGLPRITSGRGSDATASPGTV